MEFSPKLHYGRKYIYSYIHYSKTMSRIQMDCEVQYTSDIRDRSGPCEIVPYIRMSLRTDGNYVHFGHTDRKNRLS